MRALFVHGCCVIALSCWLAVGAHAQTAAPVYLATGTTWGAYNADPATQPQATNLGNAQLFCLNLQSPKACSSGAVNYGNPVGGGWNADLTQFTQTPFNLPANQQPQWIWGPGITGGTPKAELQSFYFAKQVSITQIPTSVTIALAVDDYAKVFVNGTQVAEDGSITDLATALNAQNNLKVVTVPIATDGAPFRIGTNWITIFAQNGPGSFAGCKTCKYSQNSAGVVLGGIISFGTGSGTGGPPSIPPVLLGEPGVPTNQTGSIGLYGGVPGRYDTQPSINALAPPSTVISTSVPISFVNTNTGNHVLEYLDLIYPGEGLRFAFTRFYNSMDPYSGPLGPGWTHVYNQFLTIGTTEVTWKQGDGKVVAFTANADGSYTAATKGLFDTLAKTTAGYTITLHNQTKLNFSATGKLTNIVAEDGRTLTFYYDATTGDLTQIKDPANRQFTLTYQNHLLRSLKDSENRTLTYSYDELGRLIQYVDVFGSATNYIYVGAQLKQGGQQSATSFVNTFDTNGRVVQQKNMIGTTTSFQYSTQATARTLASTSGNTVTTITDPLGRVTIQTYDSQLRLISTVDALGGVTLYTYDANNNRTSITDANENKTSFTYDSRGNLLSTTDALSHTTSYTYDSKNHLLTVRDARGFVTTYTYDANGNRLSETDALGNTTSYGYTANNLTSIVDANGNTTLYSYDGQRNLTQVTDAKNGITKYGYDARGDRTAVMNAIGTVTLYDYDDLGHLKTISVGTSCVWFNCENRVQRKSYTYDERGNVTAATDANGSTTTTTYNTGNKPTRIGYGDRSAVSYSYDAVDNRTSMVDPQCATSYSYDALNRVTAVVNSRTGTVAYAYDRVGNRLSLTYPDGKSVQYSYDAANRLMKVSDWLSRPNTYTYDAANNVIGISENGGSAATISFGFDIANRLISVSNAFAAGSDQDSIPLTNFRYTLDGVGNRLNVTDGTGQATTYTYDKLNELISASGGPSSTLTFAYDAVGNRVRQGSNGANGGSISYTYNAESVLTQAGSTNFTNDNEGRRLTAGTTSYTYDGAGRLASVSSPSGTSTFQYDGDGNRIRQVVNGTTFDYVNDVVTTVPVVLQQKTGSQTASYLWGRNLILNSSPTFEYFYLYDGLGSVVGLVDAGGRRLQRYGYDAWGQTTLSRPSPGVGINNQYQFTAENLDPGSSLYYLRHRYYDPATGRFLTPDSYFAFPLIPVSLNRFIYVRNNPVRFIDRLGRDETDDYLFWPYSPPWP